MQRALTIAVNTSVMLLAAGRVSADTNARLTERTAAHQNALDRIRQFSFSEERASMMYSLSQFGGDCQVHMIYDPKNWSRIMFKFVRDGKELVTFQGHKASTFCTYHNVLYFAAYPSSDCGGEIIAFDLSAGRQLWKTTLKGNVPGPHSGYSNLIEIGVAAQGGIDHDGEATVFVYGHESYGDYVNRLDANEGALLAAKVYRDDVRDAHRNGTK